MILLCVMMVLGLLAEFMSVQLLLSHNILLATLMHGVTSLVIVFLYKLLLTRSFQGGHWIFYVFMCLLCSFIPVFGMLLSFFMVCSMYQLHTQFHQYAEVLDESINLDDIQPLHAQYGSGGAMRHLLNKKNLPTQRTKALFKLSQTQLADMNPVIYQLLPDSSDEMRLLAFNILNEQESTITKKIDELFSMLTMKNMSSLTAAECNKNIALLYWELIYHHLVSPEIEALILDKARSYALVALKVFKHDATLWALLGKIYKHLKQHDKAKAALHKALAYKAPHTQVLPYLAEMAFHARDYQAMQQYLNTSETLLDVTRIAPVKRFWDKM